MGFRVCGSQFRVWRFGGSGFGVQGSGYRDRGFRSGNLGVWSFGFRALEHRVWGLVFVV